MANTTFHKHRETAQIGEMIAIPGEAEAITVTDLIPFTKMVQVSWLEADDADYRGATNEFQIGEIRRAYNDDRPVDVPSAAAAVTLSEPIDTDESVVYYLV